MAGYIGSKASVVSSGAERKKTFAITTSTTNLTGLSYTPTYVHVYHNGVRLVDGSDYTATNGTSIALTNTAVSGDEVVVISYATFQQADHYNKTESDVRFINTTGDTLTGTLAGTAINLSGDLSAVNTTLTGHLRGPSSFTIDPATHGNDSGTVVIAGDLTVNGTTTAVNSTTLDVADKNITLNKGSGDTSAAADGAGITIQDAVNASTDATILWTASDDRFNFSHGVSVNGGVSVNNGVNATHLTLSGTAGRGLEISTATNSYTDNTAVLNAKHSQGILSFQTAGVERLHINKVGNIGIDEDNPSAPLVVNATASSEGLRVQRNGVSSQYISIHQATGGDHVIETFGNKALNFGVRDAQPITFKTTNQTRLTITSVGKVGIDVLAPDDMLEVGGTITSRNSIVSNTSYPLFSARSSRSINDYGGLNKQYMKMHLTTPGSNTTGESSAHAYGDLRFAFTDASDATLDDLYTFRFNGNMGIGTVVPSDRLHVKRGSGTTLVKTEVGGNSTVGFEIKKTGSTTSNWRIVDGQTVNGMLQIYDVTDSRLSMSFDGAGKTLIGNITNAYSGATLSVAGSTVLANGNQFVIGTFGTSGLQLIGNAGGDNVVGTMGGSEPLLFRTASAERMRITPAGDVKVGLQAGASATSAPLHVAKANTNVQAIFGDNSSGIDDPSIQVIGRNTANNAIRYAFLGLDADANLGHLGYNAGAGGFTNALHFNTAGNVGIGTSTGVSDPVSRLNVRAANNHTNGSDREDLVTLHQGISAWQVGRGAGIRWVGDVSRTMAGISAYVFGTEQTGLAFETGGATSTGNLDPTTRMVIDHNGKVGIGTNAPEKYLHMQHGSTNAFTPSNDSWHSVIVHNNASATTNTAGIAFEVSGSAYHGNAGTGIAAVKNGTNSDYGADLVFITRPQSAVAAERMRIMDDGKVGIGTPIPAALLHIKGTGDAVRVESTNTGVGGAQMDLLHFTTSPADGDIHGSINFGGYTSGTSSAYGSAVRSIWSDVSAKQSQLEFYTRSGSSFSKHLVISSDGTVTPGFNSSQDLGSNSMRWANVYTGDLHLSNESKGGNDVDGTTGNWTVQEGEENLYLINNRTGKKYKFALEEIE